MADSALSYTYRYASPSQVLPDPTSPRLSLASQLLPAGPPLFLRARLLAPKRTGELLLTLMEVVDARFFMPAAMLARILRLADPVVTCSSERLRFEAFSQCCGAYARVDLLENALEGELLNPGTTNVDFNPPMRAALARLADTHAAALTVGADRVELSSPRAEVVERKVKLPTRWLRGFVEVQAVQARMRPAFEASGSALRRLLQELRPTKNTSFVTPAGPALRVSSTSSPGAIPVGGLDRLKVLTRAVRHAERLEVSSDDVTGASGWSIYTPDARFQYILSPDPSRGFSGEGQVLDTLNEGPSTALGAVRAALRWQSRLDPASLAAASGHPLPQIERALAACAASGLLGFDLSDRSYFHRELPFDLSLIAKHQSRFTNAAALQDSGDSIEFDQPDQAWVASNGNRYRVWLGPEPRCTCPWIAKHGNSRGPCKHILAARAAQQKAN